jgi:2',3'-cyclic-nucleotide 2'-phosphodiesterase (5'-nucleotidase family)
VSDPIDFAVQNYGGIRLPAIPKGDISVGKIYELMPFDNVMYIMELEGSIVQMFFDRMAESGGWPVSRNVYFEISYGKAKNIQIKGVPLAKSNNTGALIRDMIISHLRENKLKGIHIQPNLEKRIID